MKKRVGIGAGIVIGFLLLVGALSGGDIIDLPEWANVPGVDLPIVGDKDQIDCRLELLDDDGSPDTPREVQITVVDGDKASYPDYQFVYNNGNLVDDTVFERVADDRFVVPILDDKDEQFFAISVEPVREGRVFCESIVVSG